jgi:hypothetical protein
MTCDDAAFRESKRHCLELTGRVSNSLGGTKRVRKPQFSAYIWRHLHALSPKDPFCRESETLAAAAHSSRNPQAEPSRCTCSDQRHLHGRLVADEVGG